jgi:hypothetical protein
MSLLRPEAMKSWYVKVDVFSTVPINDFTNAATRGAPPATYGSPAIWIGVLAVLQNFVQNLAIGPLKKQN